MIGPGNAGWEKPSDANGSAAGIPELLKKLQPFFGGGLAHGVDDADFHTTERSYRASLDRVE